MFRRRRKLHFFTRHERLSGGIVSAVSDVTPPHALEAEEHRQPGGVIGDGELL